MPLHVKPMKEDPYSVDNIDERPEEGFQVKNPLVTSPIKSLTHNYLYPFRTGLLGPRKSKFKPRPRKTPPSTNQ